MTYYFFKVDGEIRSAHRIDQSKRTLDAGYVLETWNGREWVYNSAINNYSDFRAPGFVKTSEKRVLEYIKNH